MRREGLIICKSKGGTCGLFSGVCGKRGTWRPFRMRIGRGCGVCRDDPARPWASSCQLRSGVSPVPKSEGPGHPRCGFWGVETKATRPQSLVQPIEAGANKRESSSRWSRTSVAGTTSERVSENTRKRDTSFFQALRSSMPFILNLESRTCLQLAPYRSAITTGTGALFGVDRYPVTVFLALTLLTTISNNRGSLPL